MCHQEGREGLYIVEEEGEGDDVMEKEGDSVGFIKEEVEGDDVMEEEDECVEVKEQGKLRKKLFTWRSIGLKKSFREQRKGALLHSII